MRITPISFPLPGEHLAATSPVMRPETDDARWRLRLDFWAGRALTAQALELEQENRAARLAWHGRLATPGIVRGLEVAIEAPPTPPSPLVPGGHFVHVLPGTGFLPDGEDIVIPRPLRVPLDQIPVHYVRIGGPDPEELEAPPAGATAGSPRDAGGLSFSVDDFAPGYVAWAAVLVLCPAEFRAFAGIAPDDPCELDASLDAFADERRVDASLLRLCQLPARWESLPQLTDRDDPRWRNRLAHVVFSEETVVSARQQIRFLQSQPAGHRWDTVSRAADLLPWELLGVPLALLSAERIPDTASRRFFLDRAVVVRPGGVARPRTRPALRLATSESDEALNPPGAGTPFIWRAQVDQFAEHMSLFATRDETDLAALASRFQFVPPVGFLPRGVLTFLTTAQALALPPPPDRPPDRAGISHFFPSRFAVEGVPVAIEDLDAALAASAALAPYDLASTGADVVRMLVPLPQRVFDPQLLVVEQEDPIFAATLARFIATRQGWRQRRDFVRGQRDALQALALGPVPPAPVPLLEPGQLEPEPVETLEALEALGIDAAQVSPNTTSGPWELSFDFDGSESISSNSTLFFRLRLDEDSIPTRIEARWRRQEGEDLRFEWREPPPAPLEQVDEEDGRPLASPLWLRFTATADQLGVASADITAFTLHVDDGRVALASAGELTPVAEDEGTRLIEHSWWRAGREMNPVFTGGDWTEIDDERLLAPFEAVYEPVFPDGKSRDERIGEIDTALNPPSAVPRDKPMSVAINGLQRALDELEAEASEADDFVDTFFTRAQVNLYRIRKLVLGETAAQKLLVNPAIALIAEQETASASAEKLGSFLIAAKTRKVDKGLVNEVLSPVTVATIAPSSGAQGGTVNAIITGTNLTRASAVLFSGTGLTVKLGTGSATSLPITITIAAGAALGARTVRVTAGGATSAAPPPLPSFTVTAPAPPPPTNLGILFPRSPVEVVFNPFNQGAFERRFLPEAKLDALKDVFGQRPESGPTLPPRGLAIGERFKEPPATQNLSYARAALNEFLNQMPRLRLPLVGQTVRALKGDAVDLLALQGRAKSDSPETLRTQALAVLLDTTPLDDNTDEAEVTLAALDFTEIKSAILRTIERVILQRRTAIERGSETLKLLIEQRDLAAPRVLAIEGTLGEARHDVSVARALRQEEQLRVAAINDRRDALIHDEVKFLAYVRPRSVDPVRRRVQSWHLEPFGVPAPVPACLQRHDEPPVPLNAYIQLVRHAPVRWFPDLVTLLARLDTADKLVALLDSTRISALSFATLDTTSVIRTSVEAVQFTVLGAHQVIGALRQKSTLIQIADKRVRRWKDLYRDALEHAAVGDLIAGRHGDREVSSAAAGALEQMGQVATCLHAEFAAVLPAIRLAWVERFSQFDKPGVLRDLRVLPQFGRLDRNTRRRLQEFVDWLFGRVNTSERDAVNLVNDLVRLCLLLASHAPVNRIIAGHVLRPTPVRPGITIPIKPLNPELVRVGMEVHVWQASRVVARGRVEDLLDGEVSAHVDHVEAQTTTIDASMRVQFVAAGLSFLS